MIHCTTNRRSRLCRGIFSVAQPRDKLALTGLFVMMALALFMLISCTSVEAPTPTPDTSEIWQKWQSSAHADTYALEKGPNTYCARCHSPHNWDPEAVIDPPPNCVSCKFASEDRPRIAAGNPLVSENEWQDIGCTVCHPQETGNVDGNVIAWSNPSTGAYETLASSTELCEQCHRDTKMLRHKREISQEVHTGYTCTDCHDPHSAEAGCTNAGCHAEAFTVSDPAPTHDADHQSVACVACHDASGLPVEPFGPDGEWTTVRNTELFGQTSTESYQSHNLQKSVDCQRCHYAGNPWQLSAPVDEEDNP